MTLSTKYWPNDDTTVPDWIFTDQLVYEQEIKKIFHGRHWNFVGLEAEVPNVGDYKRSFVGPTAVIVSRDRDNKINVFENRCSHRGAELCRNTRGNNKTFVCPLHQWSFDLTGELKGVPFHKGVAGRGGMPADFRMEDHPLKKLHVATYNGIIFATYANDMETIEEYLTPEITEFLDLQFKGKRVRINDYRRHNIKCNWKIYIDNLRDTYHFSILHSYFLTFGLFKPGNTSQVLLDSRRGVHSVTATAKQKEHLAQVDDDTKQQMSTIGKVALNDTTFLDFKKEYDADWTSFVVTVFPGFMVNRQLNGLSVRRLIPTGPNTSYLEWIMLGYEDDDHELKHQRMRQDNFHGPSGIITMEDCEVMEFLQQGYDRSTSGKSIIKLDADNCGGSDNNLVTEHQIRKLYSYYKQVMGFTNES
jgi:anthranilate 1,2-dioxygenase large subunit